VLGPFASPSGRVNSIKDRIWRGRAGANSGGRRASEAFWLYLNATQGEINRRQRKETRPRFANVYPRTAHRANSAERHNQPAQNTGGNREKKTPGKNKNKNKRVGKGAETVGKGPAQARHPRATWEGNVGVAEGNGGRAGKGRKQTQREDVLFKEQTAACKGGERSTGGKGTAVRDVLASLWPRDETFDVRKGRLHGKNERRKKKKKS